jgi:drug/metabolite transporter (DMT)-like permease
MTLSQPGRTRALLQIHFCVFLWGFTAILGKLITLSALPLVWWRMSCVTVTLCFLPSFWRSLAQMPRGLIAIYAAIGMIVSLHWLTFYAAIKLANASVAATCMALAPVFIALVEPFVAGRRFDLRELVFGIAVVPGVALVAGGTPLHMRAGIVVGALSALLVACFSIFNKRYIGNSRALTVTGIEMAAGAVFLLLIAVVLPSSTFSIHVPSMHDSILLLALAIGCTLLPYSLSLVALKKLSAFSTALAVNLEPVYAIGFAILLLGEQRELSISFYVGVAILLATVVLHPVLVRQR